LFFFLLFFQQWQLLTTGGATISWWPRFIDGLRAITRSLSVVGAQIKPYQTRPNHTKADNSC